MNPNLMGSFPYTPYPPYPEPYQGIQMIPISFNQFNNYGYKNTWRGGNKGYYKYNNHRNNYYRGNKKYNYNNRQQQHQQQQKNEIEEDTIKNKNKIDLTEYYKIENEQDKKDYFGEKIFKAIEDSPIATERNIDMETIGKITGMIIELPEKNEILEILENSDILNSRIEEALKLLDWKK